MQKFLLVLSLFFLPANYTATRTGCPLSALREDRFSTPAAGDCRRLYKVMQLEKRVDYAIFEQALTGYRRIRDRRKDILTLIDFSKPSTEERLFVFDLKQEKLVFTSVVSHGKNSEGVYATSFSNENGSHKSSLGFYLTENTYQGRNGYSLVLNGLERGINDRAKERAIVVHGAAYSNPSVAASTGRLGRSFGCPALPVALCRPIINTIKEGSVLYIYAKDATYLSQSKFISENPSLLSPGINVSES